MYFMHVIFIQRNKHTVKETCQRLEENIFKENTVLKSSASANYAGFTETKSVSTT